MAIELAEDEFSTERELLCTDFVNVVVTDMPPIPAGENPFHHDLYSMGTALVREWMVMHSGYANAEDFPLTGMYLVNQRSGQRIRLQFTPRA